MGVAVVRLVFLGFFGLTGLIIYNALYLQDLRSSAHAPVSSVQPSATASAPYAPIVVAPVRTDLPASSMENVAEDQLAKAVQRELTALGYVVGRSDGTLDGATREAISSYQKSHGLPVTATPSDDLLRHILLGDSVAQNSSTGSVEQVPGSDALGGDKTVKTVQKVLADLGYAPGPIDGAMGGATKSAISAFQRDRKIEQTGRIGPQLLAEIKRVTGQDSAQAVAH